MGNKDDLKIIDYSTYNNKELLDPKKINDEIKDLDKKSVKYLIIKSQRLFILGKHKFYKELGYETLEDMALSEHKISRMQLHKYISIYEKLEQELLKMFNNVKSTLHFEALSI